MFVHAARHGHFQRGFRASSASPSLGKGVGQFGPDGGIVRVLFQKRAIVLYGIGKQCRPRPARGARILQAIVLTAIAQHIGELRGHQPKHKPPMCAQ